MSDIPTEVATPYVLPTRGLGTFRYYIAQRYHSACLTQVSRAILAWSNVKATMCLSFGNCIKGTGFLVFRQRARVCVPTWTKYDTLLKIHKRELYLKRKCGVTVSWSLCVAVECTRRHCEYLVACLVSCLSSWFLHARLYLRCCCMI